MGESTSIIGTIWVTESNGKLDPCDPHQSFELIVPRRARTCEVLFNAVLAFAARHKANTTGIPTSDSKIMSYEDIAIECQKKCLFVLMAMIKDEQELTDENSFAATVILRVVEEMEGQLHEPPLPLNLAYGCTQLPTTG